MGITAAHHQPRKKERKKIQSHTFPLPAHTHVSVRSGVCRLLRSPAFHRAVTNIHGRLTGAKKVNYSEMGGTKIDGVAEESGIKKFVKIYAEEFKETFRRR